VFELFNHVTIPLRHIVTHSVTIKIYAQHITLSITYIKGDRFIFNIPNIKGDRFIFNKGC
jgi:hypothetical protein